MKEADKAPVLRMRGIRKAFPGVLALDDVDLDLQAGEVLALLGENLSLIHISEPTRPY